LSLEPRRHYISSMERKFLIAVIGGRKVEKSLLREAECVGRLLAKRNAILVCGGLGGVMEAVSKGMNSEGGLTVGILPQDHKEKANAFVDVPIATGLGVGRNVIIARATDAVIAVGGGYGTLSEIAFALQMGKPVVGISTWDVKGVHSATDAEDAVKKLYAILNPGNPLL
jgi:uncharacterized protein (TIGR00725 family)